MSDYHISSPSDSDVNLVMTPIRLSQHHNVAEQALAGFHLGDGIGRPRHQLEPEQIVPIAPHSFQPTATGGWQVAPYASSPNRLSRHSPQLVVTPLNGPPGCAPFQRAF